MTRAVKPPRATPRALPSLPLLKRLRSLHLLIRMDPQEEAREVHESHLLPEFNFPLLCHKIDSTMRGASQSETYFCFF